MNIKFLLFAAITTAAFASCSSAYRSGQTPDDVYYSPAQQMDESNTTKKYRNQQTDPEAREIRMATRDRRWRNWDYDYDYRYDPYRYGYTYGYYYNPYYYPYPVYCGWGHGYPIVISNPRNTVPRKTNLQSYNGNTLVTVGNPKMNTTQTISSRGIYNNSNNSNNNGGWVREILTNRSNSSGNSNNNSRSYNPSSSSSQSSSSSGSSGSSSSSGSPVSRPSRRN